MTNARLGARQRVRRLIPLALAAGLMGLLAACDDGAATTARIAARQQAIDPPQLWRVDALDAAGGVRETTWVCADTLLRQTFVRTRPEIDGAPCSGAPRTGAAPGLTTVRCETAGRRFSIASQATGDPARDFRLTVSVVPLAGDIGPARQSHHFKRIGPCPAGWRIGDMAPS